MDGDEDSAGGGANEELLAWLHQKLGDIPEPTTPLDASRRLLADLEVVRQAFDRHDQIACEAGMLAIVRACHAFGRIDLATPFTVLAKGLQDLREGRPLEGGGNPHILRPSLRKAAGSPKPALEWDIRVEAAVCLEVLMKVIGLKQVAAAHEVADVLDKRKVKIGQANMQTLTWRQVIGVRNEIIGERCAPERTRQFRYLVDGLSRDLHRLQPDKRRDTLIYIFDQGLTRHLGINRNSPLSNPKIEAG